MRKDKVAAIEMRKNGLSYREIKMRLSIPISTISDWMRDSEWSRQIKYQLTEKAKISSRARIIELDKIRGENLDKIYAEADIEAEEEYKILKSNPLFISAIMLYWGEGDKRSRHQCRISNTDSDMIRLFSDFLRKICGLEDRRIHVAVIIYPDHKEADIIDYWQEKTGIPRSCFSKCTTIQGKHKSRRIEHGVCVLGCSSSYLKRKVLAWIRLLSKELRDYAGVV